MDTVRLRQFVVGEGPPGIVLPIVGRSAREIMEQAERVKQLPVDIVEFRADFYRDLRQREGLEDILTALRSCLGEIPILFTIRTREEGGEVSLSPREYTELNLAAARSGCVDCVDVEVLRGDTLARENVDGIHGCGVAVVGSNHHFDRTPPEEEIVQRLCREQELGCDILKIAVMPHSMRDVLTLLSATERMYTHHARKPLVTVSMGELGALSRLCAGMFGSALTFGSAGEQSAPGQIPARQLERGLRLLQDTCVSPERKQTT